MTIAGARTAPRRSISTPPKQREGDRGAPDPPAALRGAPLKTAARLSAGGDVAGSLPREAARSRPPEQAAGRPPRPRAIRTGLAAHRRSARSDRRRFARPCSSARCRPVGSVPRAGCPRSRRGPGPEASASARAVTGAGAARLGTGCCAATRPAYSNRDSIATSRSAAACRTNGRHGTVTGLDDGRQVSLTSQHPAGRRRSTLVCAADERQP